MSPQTQLCRADENLYRRERYVKHAPSVKIFKAVIGQNRAYLISVIKQTSLFDLFSLKSYNKASHTP